MGLEIAAPMEIGREYASPAYQPTTSANVPGLLSYQQLSDLFLATAPEGSKAGRLWAFNIWVNAVEVTLNDVPGVELGNEFEGTLNRIRDSLTKNKAAKTSANFASHARAFQALYLESKHNDALPPKLSDAITVRLKALGFLPTTLRSSVTSAAYEWARGAKTPRGDSHSLAILHKLEDHLQVPRDTLVSRSPAHQQLLIKGRQLNPDIPYRRYMATLTKHPYILKQEDTHLELRNALDALVRHKQKVDHLLETDEQVSMNLNEVWNSSFTVVLRMATFGRFFGFLILPKATKPLAQLSWEEQIDCGLGLPLESLRITTLINKEYVRSYLDYLQLRTFDAKAFLYEEAKAKGTALASAPLRRTLPSWVSVYLGSLTNLVSKSTGFLRLHPEYGAEVGVPPEKWQEWCTARYEELRKIQSHAIKKIERDKRSTESNVRELLRDKNPVAEIHNMLQLLRGAPPPETHLKANRTHRRDIALFSLLLFDPLRLKNLHQLELGSHIKQDPSGRWMLEMDASVFKNFIHGHAESRYRVLPKQVVDDLTAWLELRKEIPGAADINQLFINVGVTKYSEVMSSSRSIQAIVGRRTCTYFGVALGPHVLRHLQATAIARIGSPAQVKAILNDSEAIGMAFYNHARNVDEYDALDGLYLQLTPTDSADKKGAK